MLSRICRMLLRQLVFAGLVLGVTGGLAWYAMPQLVTVAATYWLQDRNMQLVSIRLERQTRLPLLVAELTLQTPTTLLQMQGLRLRQLTPFTRDWQLDLDGLRLTARPDAPASQDTSLADWQAQLAAVRPWLPARGRINDYRVCSAALGTACLTGSLAWQTRAAEIYADLQEWRTGISARLVITDQATSQARISLTSITSNAERPAPQPWFATWLPTLFSADISLNTGADQAHGNDAAGEALQVTGSLILGPKAVNLPAASPSSGLRLGPATIDMQQTKVSFSLNLPMSTPLNTDALQDAASIHINSRIEASWRVTADTLTAASKTPLAFRLDITPAGLALQLTEPLTASLREPGLNTATLTVAADSSCSGQSPQDIQCQFPAAQLQGKMTGSPYALNIRLAPLALTRQAGAWHATSTTELDVTDTHGTLLQVYGDLSLTPAGLQLTSTNAQVLGLPLQQLLIDQPFGDGGSEGDGGEGVLHGSLAASLRDVARSRALQLDLPVAESLQIDSGSVAAQLQLRWRWQGTTVQILALQTAITLQQAGFEYDHYRVAGLNASLALAGWPRVVSTTPVQMSIKALDLGVPLTNLSTTFTLSADTLSADTLSAEAQARALRVTGATLQFELLGGTATSNTFWLEPLAGKGFAQIDLASLALQQILALERDDFASSGHLSGSVPVHLDDGKVSVTAGRLRALAPGGFIRYTPDAATLALLGQSDKTKMLVDTLSDFQYHDLQVALDYSEAGDLLANSTIRGKNPHYQQGRDIHFNLTIEENVGTLLRSLRMGDDLTRKVQNRSEHLPLNRN